MPKDLQAIPFEINLKNTKWLIIAVYNPQKNLGKDFLTNLGDILDLFLPKFSNYIIIGDMNLEPEEEILGYVFKEFEKRDKIYNLMPFIYDLSKYNMTISKDNNYLACFWLVFGLFLSYYWLTQTEGL